MTDCVCVPKRESHHWHQQTLLLSHSLFSLFSVEGKISLQALFLAVRRPFPSPLFLILQFHPFSLIICPASLLLPPKYATPSPLPYSPSTPTRMARKAEGNSLDLKISMSLSLCSCRVASLRAAPRYEWPCLLASSGGPHTHTHSRHTPQNAHSFQRTLKSSYHFCSAAFVIAVIPLQANLRCSLLPWTELKNLAAMKCLLLLPNSLLRTHQSCTIYVIYF